MQRSGLKFFYPLKPMDCFRSDNIMEQTSHKVIEKRRRDRINNCLAELSQTVPAAFAKQSSGKLEKAEILEMTVEYLRAVQATEIGMRFENGDWFSADVWADFMHHYQMGYNECMQEVIRYMTDVEGIDTNDSRCVRIVSYLQTRFRPDASINTGTVYRDTINRVASQVTRMQYGTGASLPCTGASIRSLHRYNPYVPQASHGASYLNMSSPTAVVTPATSCSGRMTTNTPTNSNGVLFSRNSHVAGSSAFPVQSTHNPKPLLTSALSNSTNLPGFLFTANSDMMRSVADNNKVTGAIMSEIQPQIPAKHGLRTSPLTSKI